MVNLKKNFVLFLGIKENKVWKEDMKKLSVDIPILTYHRLTKYRVSDKYTTSINEFAEHMEYLQYNNYQTISLCDYIRHISEPFFDIPEKSCLLTFDDGHQSDFQFALPILARHNFKATFFITTDWIGKQGYMIPEQLRELATTFGMSVQCHGKRHIPLKGLSLDNLLQELVVSKRTLEDLMGAEIYYMSFPGGSFNKDVLTCVRDARYRAVMCSIPFYLHQIDGLFVVGRHMIKYVGKSNFNACLKVDYAAHIRAYFMSVLKKNFKIIVGNKMYYFLWKIYTKKIP
ncbi:MAG: polysaccharide deacetylase family protein [Bacteroidales bacterium]|nr:polysaccharide deacetylase family protein [Bacteroidales bacterium]